MQFWKITINHPILSKKPSGNWIGDGLILSNSDGSRAQSTGEIEEYPFINVSNFAVMSNRIYDRKRGWGINTNEKSNSRTKSQMCSKDTPATAPISLPARSRWRTICNRSRLAKAGLWLWSSPDRVLFQNADTNNHFSILSSLTEMHKDRDSYEASGELSQEYLQRMEYATGDLLSGRVNHRKNDYESGVCYTRSEGIS